MCHLTSSPLMTSGGAWQVNSVLIGQHVVDRLSLQTRGNEETDKIRNHEGDNDGIVLRRFKDHQNRSHRGPNDASKKSSHAHQSVSACRGSVLRQEVVCDAPDCSTQHRSDEKAGAKNTSRITRSVAGRDREELQDYQVEP